MIKLCLVLLLGLGSLISCQPQATPMTTAQPATTEDAARAAVAAYVKTQPSAALYQSDSARVVDAETKWQVLVPRTDWAGRMPNAAAFEVDKQTGAVTTLKVK
ncbi:hypothetical protein HMJ29_13455 [Hymenobacter taeanensis]|uniref:PepSY domain-containing protein n=1 Tax=Hymenobacter taeanensis TaxID=2735321 RepID=A0A6M6BJA6_9BACT|nr:MULTISPECIES: hypothetical protein [Hymenobacter]QJX47894.1 hypothetical protein HMJ29_13455 [Hymenobacter taeanensis]UOQ82664.1 hypothetical protein MUN83_07865 [Hymenobacter sp. 5414T-23]